MTHEEAVAKAEELAAQLGPGWEWRLNDWCDPMASLHGICVQGKREDGWHAFWSRVAGHGDSPRAALESLRDVLDRERDRLLATLGTVEWTLAFMDKQSEDK